MKISVITATWNSAKTVQDTLASLSSQNYSNIEYIVIDGGSTDETVDVIKESGVTVHHFVSEKDKGIYDALNKGIALATGDVVGFLHSDDVYAHPGVLSLVAQRLVESNADAVYGDLEYVAKDKLAKVIRRWISGNFDRSKIRNGWMPPHPTFYVRRSCYTMYGGFDISYRISADYESILRFLWKNRLSAEYIPEVLVRMRVGGESNRSLKNMMRKSREDCSAMAANGVPIVRALIGKNFSKLPQFFAASGARKAVV